MLSTHVGVRVVVSCLIFMLALCAQLQPVRAESKRIAIVFSQETANHFFDPFAYAQLFAAVQHQAMMAGIPFDLLSASELTDAQLLLGYDALIMPFMSHVAAAQLPAIEAALTLARDAGVGIVTSAGFLTFDENNQVLAGNPYSRMEQILGLRILGTAAGVEATHSVADISHPATRGYTLGEALIQYNPIWFDYFEPVVDQPATVLTQMIAGNTTYNGAIALERGARIAHFASDRIMMDTNLLWSVLQWVIYGDATPVALKLSRNDSIFLSRNDMDYSMFAETLALTEVPLYDLLVNWKQQYNFVGSYYLNIGNNQAGGEFTDWGISGPLYQNYMALGNEIGTHSWTHPDDTSLLTPAELEFQFNQSALEIGTQLGIQVVGAAVPGNPENLNVVQQMNQWLPYMSGRYGGVGSGYPGAVGFLSPEHQMLYFSLNMLPDFTLIGFQQLTSAAAEQIWRDEMDALRRHASQPIIHWLWHDYGPTIEAINGYGVAMYENTIAYAFNGGTEFATLANMQSRIRAFQQATLDVNSANGLTANVIAGAVGQFSLKVHSAQVIASVTGWYAYDDDQVFLPEGGGQFAIQLGGSADALTRITALPMRARLLSVTGDGSELTFSFEGEGAVTARLHPSLLIHPQVTGADNFSHNGDTLTMQFNSFGIHNVTISNGNQTPTAQAQSLTTVRDASLAITLTGSDPDGDALTFAVVSGPAHGSLSGTAPALTYTPATGYVGADSFSFVVNDGTANSLEATVSIDVQQGNTQPIANSQSLTTVRDASLAITLTGSDLDGNALTFAVVSGPTHGSLSGTAPALTYTPATGYVGADSFSFVVNDGAVNSAPATVSIDVQQRNTQPGDTQPIANSQSLTTVRDASLAITLTGSDLDGNALTFAVVSGPAHGSLSGTAPALTYTPAAGYVGADSFSFVVNDGAVNSAPATVSIDVQQRNTQPGDTQPIANSQSLTTVRDASLAIVLTGSDPNGDALTFEVVSGPTHGSLSGTAPALTYTPAAGYVGVDSFSFVVNDGTANSLEATIMLTVQAFNDASGLVLDGDLSDWANLVSFGADPDDVSGTNNLIDWREVWMAHNANDFYLAYRNDNPVTLSWGFAAFIDTDGNTATGFSMNFPIGADYLLQGDRLYQHNGGGTDWNWSLVGTAASSGEGDSVELMFPRSLLGNPTVLHLFFLSDSVAFGGMAWDAYPDAAVDPDAPAPSRSFQYTTNSE